jgi:MFS family permease
MRLISGCSRLVLQPALRNLLGFAATGVLPPEQMAQIGKYGGLLIMTGLLGWAAGGFIFGILADYIGRVRALMFSIALYCPRHGATAPFFQPTRACVRRRDGREPRQS